ncbi:stage III sporulation protein AF [Clostridium tetanomorphum]|uniref:Stage III sporulation protein AF n=1 Tax=Clostridium tetanomorphum TaxID=1553 RepID=A0A923E7K2_CLOTT|nr:stage III sporulation protein AF [Clostridium tetanomorphum]KAJ51483.1 stage III sporulation protein AF [Clostridium tetanomorphum DSM 665]MBC2396576.1 stage III sporulation protein AF [Clostridium tetanomorphum]MBP1863904.1 stage III sporulation protein AF [Clostridium tetanomorphum]NRS84982.1 stage III sporulation protein AF [Clostridium tetanomorphum]NRZ98198.1 stage III sporulation protein AF [Clostridium tetanomorphum]
MIETLRAWIVNISTVVLFITAVEMLLPDNSLKKYSKFVLGLILITVLINPLIKIFNKNFDINIYSNNISKSIDEESYKNDLKEYKEKSVENTIKTFEANLEKIVEEKIKDRFEGINSKVQVKAEYSEEDNKFNIKNVNIGIKDKKIRKVKKVQINFKKNNELNKEDKDKMTNDIREYLSKELKIHKNIINIYKI